MTKTFSWLQGEWKRSDCTSCLKKSTFLFEAITDEMIVIPWSPVLCIIDEEALEFLLLCFSPFNGYR